MRTTVNESGDTVWSFSRAELTALLAHAIPDQTRVAMHGVALDSEKSRAYSTDGHRCCVVTTSDRGAYDRAVKRTTLVPFPILESAVKNARRDTEISIEQLQDKVRIEPLGVFVTLSSVKPPPIDYVMPADPGANHRGVIQGFNAGYLADLDLVARACDDEREKHKKIEKFRPGVTLITATDELSPMLATCRSGKQSTEWRIAIMPMRI